MKQLFSTGDVAKILGVGQHKVMYAHTSGRVPEPRLRFAGHRAYTAADLQRMAEHFGVKIEEGGADVRAL